MASKENESINQKTRRLMDLFQELKNEGYIDSKRELVITEKGDCYYGNLINKDLIFFNKNCPIPGDNRVLALILLHEEGHKKFPQFQYVYSFWVLPFLIIFFLLGALILFLSSLLMIISNPESPHTFLTHYAFPCYFLIFFFVWLILKYYYSRKYLRFDEINSDIYGAICIKKKYDELNPSLITKASFDYFESLTGFNKRSKNRIIRTISHLCGKIRRIEYLFDDRYPSHAERVEIIHSLMDTN